MCLNRYVAESRAKTMMAQSHKWSYLWLQKRKIVREDESESELDESDFEDSSDTEDEQVGEEVVWDYEEDDDKENEKNEKRTKCRTKQNPKKKKTLETFLNEAHASSDDNQISKFYCVYFDNQYYWGKLLKVFADDKDSPASSAEMAFLHYKFNDLWDYPKEGEVKLVEAKYVFLGPVTPVDTLRDGFKFAKGEEALKRYKEIKKYNKLYV